MAAPRPASSRQLAKSRVWLAILCFHNHLVVDMLSSMFPFGSDAFIRLREQVWLAVFREAAAADRSIIFTFCPESTVPRGFPDRVRKVVEAGAGTVRFVHLTVSDTEQERRIAAPSRREFHKLTDAAALRQPDRGGEIEQPPSDLEINTDRSTAPESAVRIVEYFGLPSQPAAPRYPPVDAVR